MLSDEQHYQVLKALEDNPNTSQRKLAREVGYSMGKIRFFGDKVTEKSIGIKRQRCDLTNF